MCIRDRYCTNNYGRSRWVIWCYFILYLSLIHISEPTRRTPISYAVFCLKKNRDRKTGRINIVTAKVSVKDRDLILVDDMISTGGSIIKATQFLKKQKCRGVYVACTHGLFVNGAEKKIKQAGVTQIISTNTIPTNSSKVDVSKILAESLL